MLKPANLIKEKIVPTFVIVAFTNFFDGSVTGNDENGSKLKHAILREEFPINLMSEGGVVR